MASRRLLTIVLALVSTSMPWPAGAAQPAKRSALEERVARLEARVNLDALTGLLEQVAALRDDVRRLQDRLEQQRHELARIEGRQRDLYRELDGRLTRIMRSRPPAPELAGAGPPGRAELAAYQKTLDLIQTGRFEEAIDGLRAYIAAYPRGEHTGDARFWLGEVYHATGRDEQALAAFRTLLAEYPDNDKREQARLKIGEIHSRRGDKAAARRVLRELAVEHRGTAVARLAEKRLRELRAAHP